MWNAANPPARDGDYTRFLVKRSASLPVGTGDIVVCPIEDEWGPVGEIAAANSFAEYLGIFGQPLDPANPSPGYIAAYNLFKGEGSRRPGAGTVLFYRMGTPVVATADVAAGAGVGLTLDAVYGGSRGNNLKYEVVANALQPGTQVDLNIFDGTVKIESYKGYTQAQITNLQDDINAKSGWVRASGAANGTQLTTVAATALAGGGSGPTLTAGDWVALQPVLEPLRFAYFVPADLTDGSIITSLKTWISGLNNSQKSKRFFGTFGGAAGETFAAAQARSAGLNDENIVNVGVGTYRDTVLGLELSTAQLATRIVGVMAQRKDRAALSFAHLDDLEIVTGPADADLEAGLTSGVVMLGLDSSGVRIERGVTTYTDDQANTGDKPFETYSEIKYVTTMQDIDRAGRERNETGEELGLLTVNKDTREHVIANEQKDLDTRVEAKTVQPGAKAFLDPNVAISDDDNFVPVAMDLKFGRYLGQIRRTVYVS